MHSGPESERHTFDAVIDDRDLFDTYLPQFEAAVREGQAASVMCAYNRVDGAPACASPKLLSDILRTQWGFQGYVVSDCGAIGDIYLHHKFAPDANEGVAKALRAGTDLNCGVEYGNLLPAAKAGLVAAADIDLALGRLLSARFRLGLFDPPSMVKYAQIPYSVNDSPAHHQLALEAARKSIVLLKNEGGALPLSKSLKTIAVQDRSRCRRCRGAAGQLQWRALRPGNTAGRASGGKMAGRAKGARARGSDLASNLPSFETIPASALFTSNAAGRKPGLNAAYYNSANFDGQPHRPRELTYPSSGKLVGTIPSKPQPLFTRIDRQVDFHWWDGAPRPGMDDDNFGVRWTGYLVAPADGNYQLGAIGMNAFELYLDGKRIAELNNIHEASYRSSKVSLQAGKLYQIRLDYHEFVGDAAIRLVAGRGLPPATPMRSPRLARPMPRSWCWAFRRASKARR